MFIKLVKSLLDGNTDNNSFEDLVREMFGVHAYVSFTMDKVIQGIMRQVRTCTMPSSHAPCHPHMHKVAVEYMREITECGLMYLLKKMAIIYFG